VGHLPGFSVGRQKLAGQSVVVVEVGVVVSPDRGSAGPFGSGWSRVSLRCLVSGLAGVEPAHGDQAQPEVADLGQQPVQRGLVSKQAGETVSSPSSLTWRPSNQAAHWLSRTPSTRIS